MTHACPMLTRTQLTGLSDSCRRHLVTLTGNAAILAATGTTGVPPVGEGPPLGEAALSPLQSYTYSPAGDLLATHTYTNNTDCTTETYAYDMLGNRIATTDALGNQLFEEREARQTPHAAIREFFLRASCCHSRKGIMELKVRLVFAIALSCFCHAQGGCALSNVTVTAASPCKGNAEIISFTDAYFSSLAFIGQKIRCRGVLEKIKYCGPFALCPVEGELRDDDYLVHANKSQSIYIHRCNGDVKTCRCNDDNGYWQGLDGKRVIVEGVLSEPMSGDSMVSNEFMSPNLLESRISIDGGSSVTCDVVPAERQGISYLSPCREFKVTVYLTNGGRYLIHYYSAVLWMAYIGPDRLAYITRPFPLYPRLADRKKIEKVWKMLNGLEKLIFPSANNSCNTFIKCRPKRYLQIQTIEIRNPGDGLLKSVKDLFHFVYEQQNNNE